MSDMKDKLKPIDDAIDAALASLKAGLQEIKHPSAARVAALAEEVHALQENVNLLATRVGFVTQEGHDSFLLQAKIRDWRFGGSDEPVPDEDSKEYELRVKFDKITRQLSVDIDDGDYKGLCLFIEICEGKPAIHVGTDLGGDNLLHAFGLGDELVVTPESNCNPTKAEKSRFTYGTRDGLSFKY